MVAVLFAVSVIIFLIFNVIPNSDPAQRMAGKNATPELVASINEEWGFDDSAAAAVPDDDEEDLHRRPDLLRKPAKRRRTDRRRDPGDVLALHRRRGDLDVLRHPLRLPLGGQGGRLARPAADVVAVAGISMPVFWLAAILLNYLAYKTGIFPSRRLRAS